MKMEFKTLDQIKAHKWIGCACREELEAMTAVDQFIIKAVEENRRQEAIEALNIVVRDAMGIYDDDMTDDQLDDYIYIKFLTEEI